jgi:hypothetical protein
MVQNKRMSLVCVMVAGACFAISNQTCSAADPFYYSTWYAQPSPGLTWAGSSVMPGYARDSIYSSYGPVNFNSPLFYQPGYGSVGPSSPFRTTLRYYDQGYAFGSLRYGTMPGSYFNPSSGLGGYSSIGISNRFGGITTPGMLHPPWYLPGSPGNDREFLFRW